MYIQGDPFPEKRESDKNLHCSSCKVLIITDGSQHNLSCVSENVSSETRDFSVIYLQ